MLQYVVIGLLVAAVVAIAAIIAYFQNKVAQVNERINTLQSQKKASDNDIQKYRDNVVEYAKPKLDGPAVADLFDELRSDN